MPAVAPHRDLYMVRQMSCSADSHPDRAQVRACSPREVGGHAAAAAQDQGGHSGTHRMTPRCPTRRMVCASTLRAGVGWRCVWCGVECAAAEIPPLAPNDSARGVPPCGCGSRLRCMAARGRCSGSRRGLGSGWRNEVVFVSGSQIAPALGTSGAARCGRVYACASARRDTASYPDHPLGTGTDCECCAPGTNVVSNAYLIVQGVVVCPVTRGMRRDEMGLTAWVVVCLDSPALFNRGEGRCGRPEGGCV